MSASQLHCGNRWNSTHAHMLVLFNHLFWIVVVFLFYDSPEALTQPPEDTIEPTHPSHLLPPWLSAGLRRGLWERRASRQVMDTSASIPALSWNGSHRASPGTYMCTHMYPHNFPRSNLVALSPDFQNKSYCLCWRPGGLNPLGPGILTPCLN